LRGLIEGEKGEGRREKGEGRREKAKPDSVRKTCQRLAREKL